MKITNTFVLVADDCAAPSGVVPPPRGDKPTVAAIEHALLAGEPYRYTLEDLIFEVHLRRAGISEAERRDRGAAIREELLRKPHPCMRASPLTKSYGFGAHYDAEGRLAIYPRESAEYRRLAASPELTVVKAMRSRRAG